MNVSVNSSRVSGARPQAVPWGRSWGVLRTASLVGLVLLSAAGCREEAYFREPQRLGGIMVEAKVLELGRQVYQRHCVRCHGIDGDGKGVGAFGQDPPPRDFRGAMFRHASGAEGQLPSDLQLAQVITLGVPNTYMSPFALPPNELDAVIQYLKTFSLQGTGFRL